MYALIGAKTGTEYTRYKNKQYLYRLLINEWPTKTRKNGIKNGGSTMLKNRMPEPMIIRRVK